MIWALENDLRVEATMNKQKERLIQRTMDVQRELVRSGLDRRNYVVHEDHGMMFMWKIV